jgi:hypothetical protein
LGVLLGLSTMLPAAPLPASAKTPAIYALVYVGLEKNDPGNAKQIDAALHDLRTCFSEAVVRNSKVKALPLVQEQEKKLGLIERDKWAESNTRVANLEGTAVMRVWFTDGSPEEQVLIVNAIAHAYVQTRRDLSRRALLDLATQEARFKAQQKDAGAQVTEKDEREFRNADPVRRKMHEPPS